MQTLRKLPIHRRLWLILAVALVMLVSLGLLMLKQINHDLYTAKVQKTQHVVQSATGVLTYFHSLETAGTLTREQAQKQAMEAVRGLRYAKDDYFWINDLGPKMIMHPTNSKLEGQDLSALKDPDGKFLFNEMVTIAKAKGAGMVDYRWPKPGASEPVRKVSYVQLFQPWNWIVGSGVYIDDMQAEFREQAISASALGLGIAVVMALLVLYISRSITGPLNEVVRAMADIASGEGDLTRTLNSDGNDELAAVARYFNTFTSKLRTVIGQMLQAATALNQSADTLGGVANRSQQDAQQQALQMEQVATAINEVTYGVQDVAKNAEQASGEVQGAEANAQQGQANIERSLQQVNKLSGTINEAVGVIQSLAQETTQIGGVLEVIRSIAEQTNLLALNAAIEAARAGEQGRGFAVVADEVRLLAQRTQKSTAEIQVMIERLQNNSQAAVNVINESSKASQLTVEQARQAGESLNQISQSLRNLTSLNASIASATLQQAHVVEDINQNVTDAASLAHNTAMAAEQSSSASQHLNQLADELNRLLRQFRV